MIKTWYILLNICIQRIKFLSYKLFKKELNLKTINDKHKAVLKISFHLN